MATLKREIPTRLMLYGMWLGERGVNGRGVASAENREKTSRSQMWVRPFQMLSGGGESWLCGQFPLQSPGWSRRECLSWEALLCSPGSPCSAVCLPLHPACRENRH